MEANTQQQFFQQIKNQLPQHLSLVDEVANKLNVSNDSAYRRIRGEKPLDFEELKILASSYKISIDKFLHLQSESILFTDRSVQANASFNFDLYLKALIQDLTYMNSFEDKHLFYLNKDVPIFHHFAYPELAAFKCFFWMKTVVHDPAYAKEKFSLSKYMPHFIEAGKKINLLYAQIPSTEIWNIESINSTIRQIEYYKESNVFTAREDIQTVYEHLIKAVNQIEQYAEQGEKRPLDKPSSNGAKYHIYINEFILGDNSIMVQLNNKRLVYINHAVHNYMVTGDARFCDYTYDHFQNIIKRSMPISAVNEKERARFFGRIRDKINSRIGALS